MTVPPSPADHDADDPRVREQQRQLAVLQQAVEYRTSELHQGRLPWTTWLKQADLHGRYGFANTLLVPLQRATATEVRTYDEWKRHGRQVRKGEHGIRIISGRGTVYSVFDRAQTDGPDLDHPGEGKPGTSPTPESALERLVRLAERLDLYIDRGATWTYLGDPTRRIVIPDGMDASTASTLLAHQFAHVLQAGERPDPQENAPCQGTRRVRADSIAYLVLARLGIDTERLSFPPVPSWAGKDPRSLPLAAVRSVGTQVLKTAERIRKQLDTVPSTPAPSPPKPRVPATTASPPPTPPPKKPKPPSPSREVINALAAAHAFFQTQRQNSWVPGYLAVRGFPDDVHHFWETGYAPKAGQALVAHLRALGFTDAVLEEAGLVRRADGTLSALFIDRLILPLREADGTVVGFIGRRSDAARGPKYLNTPATSVFQKSQTLFGLFEGRDRLAAGARPLIVEGPLDVLAVHSAQPDGYVALAPCGTALTADHLEQLARHAPLDQVGIVLAFDGDSAGQRAVRRCWSLLREVSGPVEAVVLPEGQDPADLLRHGGAKLVLDSLHSVVQLADLVVDAEVARAGGKLDLAERRLAALHATANLIARMSPGQAARQVARVAAATGLPPAEVTHAVATAVSPNVPPASTTAAEDFPEPLHIVPQTSYTPAAKAKTTPRNTASRHPSP
ncbi:hypothetical protein GCM10009678_66480 [Actinomadura kijaniata]|uniref:DNA primase n=1 Tax=Actinomadura namibiensis TaxID=182080 RepID=A0A7W3LYI5_ACTNM|nr:toprim domain-containing protein [Actinomadura namibiensis]MBA8956550.1 DNA primase [Actinomadura namibiensis]